MESKRQTCRGNSEWIKACKHTELEEDEGIRVQIPGGGKKDAIAVFLHEDRLYAVEDRCCHSDKSLHGGDIEDLGVCVVGRKAETAVGGLCVQCPRHQRKFEGGLYFNLETGEACTPKYGKKFGKLDSYHVRVHDVTVESGTVYVSKKPRPKKGRSTVKTITIDSDEEMQVELDTKEPMPSSEKDAMDEQRAANSQRYTLTLTAIERVNHDSLIFTFAQSQSSLLPLAPSSPIWHVSLFAAVDGQSVEREYTPLSDWSEWSQSRRLRLLVKIYPDGLMTQHLDRLKVGNTIESSAPQSTLLVPSLLPPKDEVPQARGLLEIPRHVVLVAAGSGIVPMVQILNVLLQASSSAPLSSSLVYACRTVQDLLCWNYICAIAEEAHASRRLRLNIFLALSDSSQPHGVVSGSHLVTNIANKRVGLETFQHVLAAAPEKERVHAIVSGPDGFFPNVRAALLGCCQAVAVVDLDN